MKRDGLVQTLDSQNTKDKFRFDGRTVYTNSQSEREREGKPKGEVFILRERERARELEGSDQRRGVH